MANLLNNLTHVLVTLAVIGAMAALACTGTISGDLAVTIIAAVAGVSVGRQRQGTYAVADTATLPSITPASIVTAGVPFWMGIS